MFFRNIIHMGKKNTNVFSTTTGWKRARYIKRNDSVKCRLTRKIAKEEAQLEYQERELSTVDREREIAAKEEQKLHANELSKRWKVARRKEKMRLRRYLQIRRKASLVKIDNNTDILWANNGAKYIKWHHQSLEITPKPISSKQCPRCWIQWIVCNCKQQSQKVDFCMNQCEYLIYVFHSCWILINC